MKHSEAGKLPGQKPIRVLQKAYYVYWTFAFTLFAASSVWLWDPLIDAQLFQTQVAFADFFQPTSQEIYKRCLLSGFIFVLGAFASCCYQRLLAQTRKLAEKEHILESIVASEPECVKTVSVDGHVLSMNPAGLAMLGAESADEVIGQDVLGLIAPEHQQGFWRFHQRILSGKSERFEFDIVGTGGERKTLESHAVPLRNDSGEIIAQLAVTRDVTETKRLNDTLRYQASHDLLTGLVNRHEFEARLQASIDRAQTDDCMHAVFFLDLDQFKVINDTCGHEAGDALLKQVAMFIKTRLRKQDTVARLGGDEFAVLLDYCGVKEACAHAESLRKEIEQSDFYWEGRIFKTSASIGIVAVDRETASVGEVLRNADSACYVAKDRGRNRTYLYHPEEGETRTKQGEMKWVARIHEGIRDSRFCLYAQLIQNLASSGAPLHAEILLRYREADGKLIPPGAFLPAAERYDVISRLDRFVLESTLEQIDGSDAVFATIDRFCINLSGQSVAEESFLEFVVAQFAARPELAKRICFEVTETAVISDIHVARNFIERVRELGCEFSLDDFGSGLSSFGYLKNLPVDYVKIDGEFVRDIATDETHFAMIRSINEIAHLMNKRTVAEFVEDDATRLLLNSIGVDYAQGYGIHVPQPLAELESSIAGLSKAS